MRIFWKFAIVGLLAAGMHTGSAHAQEQDADIAKLRETVRTILIDTPEILQEAIQVYIDNQNRIQGEEQREVARNHFENSTKGPLRDIAGEANDDTLVLVEFFDYRCPHCRSGATHVKEYLRKDGNTKFYLAELPILGEESLNISKISVSAWMQSQKAKQEGKTIDYFDFHDALIDPSASELPDTKRALELANQFGYDMDLMRAALTDQAIDDVISNNHRMAQEIGIRSTPGFLMYSSDGSKFEGFVGAEDPDFIAETAARVRSSS